MTSLRQATAERKRLAPSELEKVVTVYGETVYIPRDRTPGRMIPMYKRNGTPRVTKIMRGHYRPDMLHPENIFRPDMQPLPDEYLQLLGADDAPSENHTTIFMSKGLIRDGIYLVETMESECYLVKRNPDMDTTRRRAWIQVIP